nr:glutamate 5-kinase [Brevibacillus sp. SYP-B805]
MKEKMRIVIKAGSSTLAFPQGGCDLRKMSRLVNAISKLKADGHEIVFVSSGAVASGYKLLGYQQRPRTLVAKQAAAAIGQSVLMQTYSTLFAEHNLTIAQILLTRSDFSDRERYHHAFQTLSLLLAKNIIPVINENDTVSVAELTFGDNDMLGALVAGLVHADFYIILTDTNGLYDKDPRKHPDAKRISSLPAITEEIEQLAGGASRLGTGGMRSKLLAAKTALALGVPSFIGQMESDDDLRHIVHGAGNGTYIGFSRENRQPGFLPKNKQWIALHSPVHGRISVDDGAAEALLAKQRSLLAAGIKEVAGSFAAGDVIEVYHNDRLIGRGVSRLAASDLGALLASAAADGKRGSTVIHRDQWIPALAVAAVNHA